MGRRPCCAKVGLERGAWTAQEDRILSNYIKIHGEGKWRDLPQRAELKRCGKSCRLRWLNYLKPDIKRGNITVEEEDLIIRLHKLLGNRWSLIAGRLPGRTDNEIKNYWNTNLSKRMQGQKNQNYSTKKKLNNINLKKKEVVMGNSSMPRTPIQPHPVIRTKAVRCTKVFIPQHQHQHQHQHLDNQNFNKYYVPTWPERDSSLVIEDDYSSKFLLDLDISELLVLNSEFHQEKEINEDDNGGDYSGINMSSASVFNFPLPGYEAKLDNLTDEALVENWNFSDSDSLQPMETLASFLNWGVESID